VSASADVRITFPSDYNSLSSATCISVVVDSIAVNTFNCTKTGTTIIFTNVFTTITNLLVKDVIIMVGNILNPSPAIYTGSFSGYIGDDYAEPVGTGLQLTAGKSS
jgi:hypothetical protein